MAGGASKNNKNYEQNSKHNADRAYDNVPTDGRHL